MATKRVRLDPWRIAPWLGLAAALALWRRDRRKPGLSDERQMSPESFEAAEPGRGRGAARPHQIPARGWRDIVWRTWTEIREDRLQIVAAGVTFYTLLALFPAMGAFVALYGLFADVADVRKQLNELAALLPPGAVDLIGREMLRLAETHQASLSTAFFVSLLLSIWSANAGVGALLDGLNIAYDETETRPWLRRTGISLGFTVAGLAFMMLTAGAMVSGPLALGWLGLARAETWWLPVVWLMVFGAAVLAFSVVYRFGPSRQHARWRWVSWGGIAAALAWIAGSLAFSLYVGNFGHYDRTYGSLGVFVGVMVWLWFSIFTILLGAELNAEIEHQTAVDTTTGAPMPMGDRGAVMADTVGKAATSGNRQAAKRPPSRLWSALRGPFSR